MFNSKKSVCDPTLFLQAIPLALKTMWSMFRSLSLATACVASVEEMAFDDESLSLIQLRASGHHRSQWNPGDPLWLHPSVTESPYGKKKANGEYGNEVKERPKVDDYKCDTSHLVPGVAWVLDKPMQNCKVEMKDDSLGAIRDGPGDVITGVRFYAAQAGNNGLRRIVFCLEVVPEASGSSDFVSPPRSVGKTK